MKNIILIIFSFSISSLIAQENLQVELLHTKTGNYLITKDFNNITIDTVCNYMYPLRLEAAKFIGHDLVIIRQDDMGYVHTYFTKNDADEWGSGPMSLLPKLRSIKNGRFCGACVEYEIIDRDTIIEKINNSEVVIDMIEHRKQQLEDMKKAWKKN